MTRKRKKDKAKAIHGEPLKQSIVAGGRADAPMTIDMLEHIYPGMDRFKQGSWDFSMLEATFIIQEKFLDLTEAYQRIRHVPLEIPDDIKNAIVLWRTLFYRYKHGDFRHTEEERRALAMVAQWSVDEQRKLRNQEPVKLDLLGEGV